MKEMVEPADLNPSLARISHFSLETPKRVNSFAIFLLEYLNHIAWSI